MWRDKVKHAEHKRKLWSVSDYNSIEVLCKEEAEHLMSLEEKMQNGNLILLCGIKSFFSVNRSMRSSLWMKFNKK